MRQDTLPQDRPAAADLLQPARPVPVAFICNHMPPYRVHVHQRIARELPQIELWTLTTHGAGDGRWGGPLPAEIRPVVFGAHDPTTQGGQLRYSGVEWRKAGRIIAWLKRHDIRAVVMHGYNDLGRLRIIRWCRTHGVPCLLWADSNIAGDRATGIRRVLKRAVVGWVVRQCEALLPCGRMGRAFFERYGARPGQVFYFPLEPDYALIEQAPEGDIVAARQRFGLAPERKRLVFSGRLISLKRVDLLLQAFGLIAERRPDWDLLMIGDGPLRQELQDAVPPQLRQRVLWTGFLDNQATVSALYRCSDTLVLPGDYEAWALVVNEAAAAGLAIVCSDIVGSTPELVHDGVNGRLFPRGDLPALAQALLDATTHGRTESMKAASRQVLAEWRDRADPVRQLLRALQYCGAVTPTPLSPGSGSTGRNLAY